jgi:hypothetical protein
MRLEAFNEVNVLIVVSWAVTLHNRVDDYQHSGGTCCLHLYGMRGEYLLCIMLSHAWVPDPGLHVLKN